MNKVVEQILCAMVTNVDSKWVYNLSFVELAINSSLNTSTGKTPFEMVYREQVRNVINQLDGLHRVEGT